MKPITARNWPKQRPKLSVQFDMNCHKVAGALLALQSRELMAMQQQKAGSLNQRSMLQMAQSIRKIQEVGRMALGETTDRQQLDLDFDPPDIRLTIIDGQIQTAGR
jgi:hypothetical protein